MYLTNILIAIFRPSRASVRPGIERAIEKLQFDAKDMVTVAKGTNNEPPARMVAQALSYAAIELGWEIGKGVEDENHVDRFDPGGKFMSLRGSNAGPPG